MLNSALLMHIRRHSVSLLILSVLLFCSTLARAQGGVGSTRGLPDSAGGIHTIQGHVYLPSGRRAGAGILIKLEGNVNGTRSAPTDSDGSFLFNSLPASEYSIFIDGGTEYDSVRQPVTIYGTTGGVSGLGVAGQTIMLDIHLRPKGGAESDEKQFAGVPKQAVDNYKKALETARAGDHKKAVEQLNSALAIHPKFAVALSELGTQYLKLQQMDKVAETMDALLKLTPSDAMAHLNLGIALFNQKKLDTAETHLREAIKLNSAIPAAHYYLGLTLVSAKKYDEAEKELELTVSSGGDNLALAHKYLGGLYMNARKNQQAADELEKYLKLDPKASDADRIRGTIKDLRSKQ